MCEIISLQLGHYSNFIGSHRWNIQESQFHCESSKEVQEVNHYCTFREGKRNHGVATYTPRLIAVDLQGSLPELKDEGNFHDTDESYTKLASQLWDGKVEVCREESGKSEQPTDTSVDMLWSDSLMTKLHPNTVMTLPGYWHNEATNILQIYKGLIYHMCNAEIKGVPFDSYPAGIEAAQNVKFVGELEDRLHFFTEECDHLQGFQLLANMQDGFGGVANEICAHMLHDQFPKKAIWFNGVAPPPLQNLQAHQEHYKILNFALTMVQTLEHSSIFIPVSTSCNAWGRSSDHPRVFPHLFYGNKQMHQSTAIIAAAMETITLPCCLDTNSCHMWDMIVPHTNLGRKVVSLSCCLPLPLVANSNLTASLAGNSISDHFTLLSPEAVIDKKMTLWSEHIVLRGIPTHYPLVAPNTMPSSLSSLLSAPDKMFTTYQLIQKPLFIPKTFPKIFSPHVTSTGLISHDACMADVRSVPMGASLHSNSSIHHSLATLLAAVKSINIKRYPVFSTTCLDYDGWTELQQSLHDLVDCYVSLSAGDWSSDSD